LRSRHAPAKKQLADIEKYLELSYYDEVAR